MRSNAGPSTPGKKGVFSPLLCEVNVFLRQDGEDLVEDLVWIGLSGQSNVVLRLAGKRPDKEE